MHGTEVDVEEFKALVVLMMLMLGVVISMSVPGCAVEMLEALGVK